MHNEDKKEPINHGLEGIVIAATTISNVDGIRGELVYAGYMLEELIDRNCSYEDVVHLFLRGRLPSPAESQSFAVDLASKRALSPALERMIDAIPRNLDYMDALRTGISALSCEMDISYPPTEEQALHCIAKAPMILSRYYRLKTGQPILTSISTMSHAANYLYMLTGNTDGAYARALNTYFITTIEHGMNASTFAARVSTSTQSDLVSSIAAAISTLKGPLHGGAPLEVIHMLEAIGTIENTEPWIRNKLEKKEPLMGFGHRVYKTYDPRATALRQVLETLPQDDNNRYLNLSRHVQEVAIRLLNEYKPGRDLYPNVEFGAAGVLRAIGLPEELYPATFGVSRCGGWVAHIIEQAKHNRLMRPTGRYDGPWPQVIIERKQAEQNALLQPHVEITSTSSPSVFSSSIVLWKKPPVFTELDKNVGVENKTM